MEKILPLKNGTTCLLREMTRGDAPAMIPYIASIAGESDNLTFGPGEFAPSREDEEKFIDSHLGKGNCCALVVVQDGRILGNLSFSGGTRERTAHAGEFGLSVLKEYWGNGLGRALLEALLEWAETAPIGKINLRVRADNAGAIALYEKLGFRTEGKIRRDFRIGGEYFDSLQMGLMID